MHFQQSPFINVVRDSKLSQKKDRRVILWIKKQLKDKKITGDLDDPSSQRRGVSSSFDQASVTPFHK